MNGMAERIEEALARIEDFEAVQRGAGPEGPADAVLCLQASVGIDDEARLALREGLERSDRSGQPGPILMGPSGTQAHYAEIGDNDSPGARDRVPFGCGDGKVESYGEPSHAPGEREVVEIAAAGVALLGTRELELTDEVRSRDPGW
jgi:hypothetical protein